MYFIGTWFKRHFSDPQVVLLWFLVLIGFLIIVLLGHMLAPVLASVAVAYLLQGLISILERIKIPRSVAVVTVFSGFMLFLAFLSIRLLPLLWQQFAEFFQQLPTMIAWTQQQLLRLPERYPELVSERQILEMINALRSELTHVGQQILTLSIASARVMIWIVAYMFLAPLLIFFMLKDKDRLLEWLTHFLPQDRTMASEVWQEVDQQIGNFARGKFWEILIVWVASYLTFAFFGLQFSMLISLFVGLSVLVPYIGATVMTFPVGAIAYFQWGLSPDFAYVVGAYIVLQLLDGNVLAPLLFSEVVNLHPVAVIVAILLFGGIFGFWGVFFAIPLATLVQAILRALSKDRGPPPSDILPGDRSPA